MTGNASESAAATERRLSLARIGRWLAELAESGGYSLVRGKPETRRPPEGTGHTRTSTNGHGPDYCAECSEAICDWVEWPCATRISRILAGDFF